MKFTPRSEETRRFIIETTAGIFNTKGYAGTSMSDLTEATKLTKGSIYGNFENKEEVALAVFDHNIACRDRIIAEQLSKATNNKEKLLLHATVFGSTQNHRFPEGGCPILNAGTEADDTFEPMRKKVNKAIIDWKKDLETIINQGIAAREFRKDTQAEKTALSIMALIEGGILLGKSTNKANYLDTVLETVKDLIHNITLT
jgi:AcrR family transcriptional regulator